MDNQATQNFAFSATLKATKAAYAAKDAGERALTATKNAGLTAGQEAKSIFRSVASGIKAGYNTARLMRAADKVQQCSHGE